MRFVTEAEKWQHHFRYYDFFQNNSRRYRGVVEAHAQSLRDAQTVLDAGCGTGNLTLQLLREGHTVTAVDTSEPALEILREKCSEYADSLRARHMSVTALDLPDASVDGVASMFVLPFVGDMEAHFREVHRVLRRGGILTLSSWAPEEDAWQGVMEENRREFESKRLLPRYEQEWNFLTQSSRANLELVLKAPTLADIGLALTQAGFSDLTVRENPYEKYAFYIDART